MTKTSPATTSLTTIDGIYSELDDTAVDTLRNAASKIRSIKLAHAKLIIATGEHLIRAQELLPHGHWAVWLNLECSFAVRTASNYMSVAAHFGKTKTESVADLRPTTLYKLAAPLTPETVRQDILKRLDSETRPLEADIIATVEAAQKHERLRRRDVKETEHLSEVEREAELRRRSLARLKDEGKRRGQGSRGDQASGVALRRIGLKVAQLVPNLHEFIVELREAKITRLPEVLEDVLLGKLSEVLPGDNEIPPTAAKRAA